MLRTGRFCLMQKIRQKIQGGGSVLSPIRKAAELISKHFNIKPTRVYALRSAGFEQFEVAARWGGNTLVRYLDLRRQYWDPAIDGETPPEAPVLTELLALHAAALLSWDVTWDS